MINTKGSNLNIMVQIMSLIKMLTPWTKYITSKAILALSMVFAALSYTQTAQAISVNYSCTVTSNYLAATKHGQVEKYGGYADRFEVGDALDVKYDFVKDELFAISVGDKSKSLFLTVELLKMHHVLRTFPFNGKEVYFKKPLLNLSIGNEFIHFDSHEKTFNMSRYSESTWQGMYSSMRSHEGSLQGQILSIDCKTSDDVDLAISKMTKLLGSG